MRINEELTALEAVYQGMYMTVLVVLAIMLFACLIRAVRGPRVADRIVAVNMMGTMVMVMITVLSLLLEENFLVDICLIYALVSFLAVIVITKVYVGVYREGQQTVREGTMGQTDGKPKETSGAAGKNPAQGC